MNKTAVEIVKQYIIETTDSTGPGITARAKDCLEHLMKEDREMAMTLWDRLEGLDMTGMGTYVFPSELGDGNESDNEWNS